MANTQPNLQNGEGPDSDSDIDAYFTGPIDTTKASKLPYFMRLRGSVLPGLIIPMLFVTAWAVWITCVLFLPFQLVATLKWITIPGTLIAAYIILGFAAIGREIEDPFGDDVNDLNLDFYCETLSIELDMIMSVPPPKREWIVRDDNHVMFPNTNEGYSAWKAKGIAKIREELKKKPLCHINPDVAREFRHNELVNRDAELDRREREKTDAEAGKKEEPFRSRQDVAHIPTDISDAV
ncbi:hypothetical protein Dda_6246 [Drechslerella dactyloides]|uniref:Uncharacterized protein n=1 Tax=Drechslerella dactyloides TaxID=74499 RepID=A0AAD6NH46_DREDA|nr:hypothetical protein Dda_6246 [Drechslerella dactyloides]